VRERIGHDVSGRLSLNLIVADGAGRAQCFFNVTRFEHALVLHLARKHAGEEISLQLQPHRQLIRLSFTHALLQRIEAFRDPE